MQDGTRSTRRPTRRTRRVECPFLPRCFEYSRIEPSFFVSFVDLRVLRVPSSISDFPDRAFRREVELAHLLEREGTRADAAEDGDLPAGLVHRPVAVEALRERTR